MIPPDVGERDRYLEERAKELIASDASLRIEGLRAEAKTGVLRLAGEVASEGDRDRAGLLAKSVKGSVTVANDIRVKATSTDEEQPAGSSSAEGAPDDWVESYRDMKSTPQRDGDRQDQT